MLIILLIKDFALATVETFYTYLYFLHLVSVFESFSPFTELSLA